MFAPLLFVRHQFTRTTVLPRADCPCLSLTETVRRMPPKIPATMSAGPRPANMDATIEDKMPTNITRVASCPSPPRPAV